MSTIKSIYLLAFRRTTRTALRRLERIRAHQNWQENMSVPCRLNTVSNTTGRLYEVSQYRNPLNT